MIVTIGPPPAITGNKLKFTYKGIFITGISSKGKTTTSPAAIPAVLCLSGANGDARG